MTDQAFVAEVRRVETEYAETGDPAKGQPGMYAPRVDVTYEVGAEVNGAWVKFGSVPGSTVDSLVAAAQSQAPPQDEGPTMAEVTPTPAPQAEAEGSTTV